QRLRLRAGGHRHLLDPVHADADGFGTEAADHRRRLLVSVAEHRCTAAVRDVGIVPCLPAGILVDAAHGVVAPRQPAPHPVQHVLGEDAGARDRRAVRSGRTVIIYVVSGICGFLLSSTGSLFPIPFLRTAGLTMGASASILGMVGALVHYGGKSGSSLI